VSTYRTRVLRKMGLRSTADMVRYALTHDLV
jgi:DNA-binding NarL/FixJ family response regulator